MTVEELNHYKSSGTDFTPIKLIQTDITTLRLDICELNADPPWVRDDSTYAYPTLCKNL
jgi:hypothetical protein